MKLIWRKSKPTVPGRYRVLGGSKPEDVIVTRRGRGLSVYCPAYSDRVPMSEIVERELE